MDWHEIVIEIVPEGIEAAANIAEEAGAGGVAIEDPRAVAEHISQGVWDAYELPDYLTKGDFARVRVYQEANESFPRRFEELKRRLNLLNTEIMPDCIKNIFCSTIKEEDWAESWKQYYKPVRIGKTIVIKPTWEEADLQPGDMVIELDPGMAFGTGTHPTTVLCLEFLEQVIGQGFKVYDVGTGSGILAIAAAKLGAMVTALDIDELAVGIARENVAVNGMEDRVVVQEGDLLAEQKETVDLIIANIVADVIKKVIPQSVPLIRPGGLLLSSGIFVARLPEVMEWLEKAGFNIVEVKKSGDWAAVLATKP